MRPAELVGGATARDLLTNGSRRTTHRLPATPHNVRESSQIRNRSGFLDVASALIGNAHTAATTMSRPLLSRRAQLVLQLTDHVSHAVLTLLQDRVAELRLSIQGLDCIDGGVQDG